MNSKNNIRFRVGIVFGSMLITVVCVFAVKGKWFTAQKHHTPATENWVLVHVDAWPELNAMLATMTQSFPFVLNGKAILKNNQDSIIETSNFSMAYFDQSSFRYLIDKVEMLQTKNWQVVVDRDRKLIAVNAVTKPGSNPFMSKLDMAALKAIFSDNRYTWKIMQNDRGQRLLVSDEFNSDGFSGLKIRYDMTTHHLISVNMGMPQNQEEGTDTLQSRNPSGNTLLKLSAESLELVYEPLKTMPDDYLHLHPDSVCVVKQKKITILDKELQKFSVINNIK